MTNEVQPTTRVTLTDHVEVDAHRAHPAPQLIEAGQSMDLGHTDLGEHLLTAITQYQRISIQLPGGGPDEPTFVHFTLQAIKPFAGHDLLECCVRLIASSGVQRANPHDSRAYVVIDMRTGQTQLRCDSVGYGRVTQVSQEPSYTDVGYKLVPTGQTSLTAFVEYGGQTYRWAIDEGDHKVGDLVLVRFGPSGYLKSA